MEPTPIPEVLPVDLVTISGQLNGIHNLLLYILAMVIIAIVYIIVRDFISFVTDKVISWWFIG